VEFVYSVNDGFVTWGPTGSSIRMRPNDIWHADDPFVVARPDLFSATPVTVHSTIGKPAPDPTPVAAPKKRAAARG